MNVLKSLTNLFRTKSLEIVTNTSIAPDLKTWGLNVDNIHKVKEFAGWLFIAVNMICKSVASIKVYPEIKSGDGFDEIPDKHWLKYLWGNPNPNLDYDMKTIFALSVEWLKRHGKAFIYLPAEKLPYMMYVLPADCITILTDRTQITGYEFRVGSNMLYIPKEQMIYLKNLSADSYENTTITGIPTEMNSARQAHLTIEENEYFYRNFMEKDGTAPYIVATEKDMGEEQIRTFFSMLKEQVPAMFRPKALMPSGLKMDLITQPTTGSSIVSNVTTADLTKKILAHFNVPMSLVIGELQNKDTGRQVRTQFYTVAVMPLIEMICSAFTRHFKQYDENVKISFDPYLENDEAFLLLQTESDLNFGIKSIDEVRAERGYPELENGLGSQRIIKNGFMKLDNLINPPEIIEPETLPEIQVSLKKKSMNEFEELTKMIYWKSLDRHNAKYVKQLESIVSDTFLELGNEILDNNNLSKSIDGLLLVNKKIESADGFKLFDIMKWTDILASNTKKWTKDFITSVMIRAGKDIGNNIELTEYEKQIAKLSKKSTSKITTSLGTIEIELKKEVSKIVEQNPLATKDELKSIFKDKLQTKFKDVFSQSRSNLIAQTTSTFTSGQSQKEVWNKENFVFTWLTQRDGDVRDSHVEMDGKYPDENGYFNVNGDVMQSPGGGSDPAENCNCRCVGFPKKRA